jgi:hypothetical protein
MFAPRRLCVYPQPLLAAIFSTPISPLSPLFPLPTQKQGIGEKGEATPPSGSGRVPLLAARMNCNPTVRHPPGAKCQPSARPHENLKCYVQFFCQSRPIRKMANHYRFSHLSKKSRRADISHDSAEESPASEGRRYRPKRRTGGPRSRAPVTGHRPFAFHESRITFHVGAPAFALRERNQSKDWPLQTRPSSSGTVALFHFRFSRIYRL